MTAISTFNDDSISILSQWLIFAGLSIFLHAALMLSLTKSNHHPTDEINWRSTSYSPSIALPSNIHFTNTSTPAAEAKAKMMPEKKTAFRTLSAQAEETSPSISHLKTHAATLAKTPPPLPYPETARQAKHSGSVTLKAKINLKGRIQDINVVSSSGHSVLDEAATRWFQSLLFTPEIKNGRYIPSIITQKINFKLVSEK
jgi:TonB family protein